jgi:uncharacterized membrane protein
LLHKQLFSIQPKGITMKTQDVAVVGICAALYAVVGRLTDLGITFGGVAFWPAVVIPAIFAVLFGPWVGGFSGAIGIFIRDMLFHGNAALSLVAGVPPNFILFFIIGYLSVRKIDIKKTAATMIVAASVIIAGLIVPTMLYPVEFAALTGLSTTEIVVVFASTVIVSLVVIAAVAIRWRQWRSYAVGAVVGQAAGAALLSVTVWAVSPLFLSYFQVPVAASFIMPLFVWTFATEIPFILLVGPPVIKACYKAFPSLQQMRSSQAKGETSE